MNATKLASKQNKSRPKYGMRTCYLTNLNRSKKKDEVNAKAGGGWRRQAAGQVVGGALFVVAKKWLTLSYRYSLV